MKVYIAGRITGDPRYREKFAEAEAALREENVGRVPADTDPALIAAMRCSATVGGDKDCAHCAYGQRTGDLLSPDDPPVLRLLEDEYYCDCDRMALDAAQRLEDLTGVDGNG